MRIAIACVLVAACGGGPVPATLPTEPPRPIEATPAAMKTPEAPPEAARPWPATRTQDLVETAHGHTIRDPYRWLEDEHSPDVQAWMAAQDTYARAELAKAP